MAEFLAYVRANPGKLNYGSAGPGTLQHIAIEMIMDAAKFKAVHVPYKGSQQIMVDLLAGRLDFTMDLGAAIPQIQEGKLQLLAVPGKKRSPIFPEAPTLIELGVDVDLVWVCGVYAPAGTPRTSLRASTRKSADHAQPGSEEGQLDAIAAEALPAMTPEAFAAHQQRVRDNYGAIVRSAGIKAN